MKEVEAVKKILAEKWAAINKQEAELEAARQDMEQAAENLNAVNDDLSFEKFKDAKRHYEDTKDYYEMLQRAHRNAETATDNDYKLYQEMAYRLSKAFAAEQEAAEKEALKPARELAAIFEKHEKAQRSYIEMNADLKAVLHISNMSAGPNMYELMSNKRSAAGDMMKAACKFTEEKGK